MLLSNIHCFRYIAVITYWEQEGVRYTHGSICLWMLVYTVNYWMGAVYSSIRSQRVYSNCMHVLQILWILSKTNVWCKLKITYTRLWPEGVWGSTSQIIVLFLHYIMIDKTNVFTCSRYIILAQRTCTYLNSEAETM